MKKHLLSALMGAALAGAALAAQAAPVFNIFELGIQPGQAAAYDAVGEHNVRQSVGGEAGTLAMHSVKQQANPLMAYMFEIYADEAAYRVHTQSPQYKAFLQRSPGILTEHKRKIAVTPQFLADKPIHATENTRVNYVAVDVRPEDAAAFARIVLDEMAQSIQLEPGVLAMYAATETARPHRWHFFEVYADEAAYQQHRQTPHFQHYLKETAHMLQDKHFTDITPTLLMSKGGLRYMVKP